MTGPQHPERSRARGCEQAHRPDGRNPAEHGPHLRVLRGRRWRVSRWKTNLYSENAASKKQGQRSLH